MDNLIVKQTAIDIVEVFEDLLEKFDIVVPAPGDEEDRAKTDNAASLYGCVYGDLLNDVTDIIWWLVDEIRK